MQDKGTVLVLADHSLLGALLGLWVETVGAIPVFPRNGQPPEAALEDIAPRVILVDVEHPAAASDALHEAAARGRIPVLFVGPARLRERLLHAGARHGARAFMIPEERTRLGATITAMSNGGPASD